MPVPLGVDRKCRVDADRYDVLVLIPRLERGQQHCRGAGMSGIPCHASHRSDETLVVADVGGVETGSIVPRTIAFRSEPLVGVPRRVRVAVKVDHDVVRVVHAYRGHRSWNNGAGSVHDYYD